MRSEIFRAYYLKIFFIQIINFLPHVLNNYRPKKRERDTYFKMAPKISRIYLINPPVYFAHYSYK